MTRFDPLKLKQKLSLLTPIAQEKSDNSGDETSDSGVQTPPPELVSDQDDKPVKAELLSALDELRSQTKRTRTRSQ